MIYEAVRALITGACAVVGISLGPAALSGVDHFLAQTGGFAVGSLLGHGASHVAHSAWRRLRHSEPVPLAY